ncbi:MAG TPA: hypothetical protein VFI31_09710 [Pirellulales bacterium]|nr:hypothetical protein [Pirellulales bacterium]
MDSSLDLQTSTKAGKRFAGTAPKRAGIARYLLMQSVGWDERSESHHRPGLSGGTHFARPTLQVVTDSLSRDDHIRHNGDSEAANLKQERPNRSVKNQRGAIHVETHAMIDHSLEAA